MIGNQIKGTNFRGLLKYLHGKEKSALIGGNMVGKTPKQLAAEFQVARKLNPRLQKAVYHASLSLAHDESLDDEEWSELGREYVEGMGFEGSQYVIYRHQDTEHDHIHIVASRIRITDGTTVSDSWDYVRSEKLIRELEKKYELTPTVASNLKLERGQTTGEKRLIERTGVSSVRLKLQGLLDEVTEEQPTMPELISKLKNQGVDARVSYTRTGKVKGISYSWEGVAISGTHLGKAYTFPGLQKHRGVAYENSMDSELQMVSAIEPVKPSQQTIEPEIETKQTVDSQEQQRDKELEAMKLRYRHKYEQLKSRVQNKLGNKRTSIEEIDVEIGMVAIAEAKDGEEVFGIMVQSEKVDELKAVLPESEYQQRALEYIREICNRALERNQELEKQKSRQRQKQNERGFDLEL